MPISHNLRILADKEISNKSIELTCSISGKHNGSAWPHLRGRRLTSNKLKHMLPGLKHDLVTNGSCQLITVSEDQLALGSNRTKTHILLLSFWPIFTNKLPRKLKKRLASKVNQSVNHRTCSHGNSSVKQNQIKLSFCERYNNVLQSFIKDLSTMWRYGAFLF